MLMGTQKGGASSSTRLQPQLTSSSLGLCDLSDMFAGVMRSPEELQHNMNERMDRVEERAQKCHESLRDELTDVKSQARSDQAQLIRDTDQCLAERLAMATKESLERDVKMTREVEQLLNDHDNTYAHTMISLEKRLDAKADLMMRKLDEILSSGNREDRHAPTDGSRQTTDGGVARGHAGAQPRSRTSFESNHRERPRADSSGAGRTNPAPTDAEATSRAQSQTRSQVRSGPDLTTISQDTTMYASMFEPLNRSLETSISKLSKSTEREEKSRRTFKKPKSFKDHSDGCIDTWIEAMKLHFEEENLSKKQECSALTSNLDGTV